MKSAYSTAFSSLLEMYLEGSVLRYIRREGGGCLLIALFVHASVNGRPGETAAGLPQADFILLRTTCLFYSLLLHSNERLRIRCTHSSLDGTYCVKWGKE